MLRKAATAFVTHLTIIANAHLGIAGRARLSERNKTAAVWCKFQLTPSSIDHQKTVDSARLHHHVVSSTSSPFQWGFLSIHSEDGVSAKVQRAVHQLRQSIAQGSKSDRHLGPKAAAKAQILEHSNTCSISATIGLSCDNNYRAISYVLFIQKAILLLADCCRLELAFGVLST